MKRDEALEKLEALGAEDVRKRNDKRQPGVKQFGVKMGDIRKLAKTIKHDPELARALWKTGIIDAQCVAILILEPKDLSADELDGMVRTGTFHWVADWLNAYLVKKHADKEALREKWMTSDDPMAARAGWNLTAERVVKSPDGLDLPGLLDRIESEMGDAPEATQWTMNACLAEIGIHHEARRKRALAIGESLGVYRDFPAAKGCTSPFAPIWIHEMVSRQG